ncbi:Golgi-associated kinase 1B [Odontesthes bonariensis]|uniref:Golgi-associated kinase 1B n=1 Tax=Odontesthes bonariensis TaxID=219752 RepID=UPI003F5850AE
MGKSRVHWLCFPFLKLTSNFRRCSLSKRSLLIAIACSLYLFFVVSHVGHPQRKPHKRTDKDKDRHTRGYNILDSNDAMIDSADLQNNAKFVVPTRSNVVYITLKSKRQKPPHIRGTIKPKLRRKLKKTKTSIQSVPQNRQLTAELDAGQIKRNFASETSWKESSDVDYKSLNIIDKSYDFGADSKISSIRIFSKRAPPWFSAQDLQTMRFLADGKVLRMKEIFRGNAPSLLIFEGESIAPLADQKNSKRNEVCRGQCGIIHSPVDNMEVFAFHLDRVLGINRTLPAVNRKFSLLHDARSCPVVSWDASLYPKGLAAGLATVRLTWGEYQSSLKQRCWHKNISPKPNSGCATIHHYEWSKLALFDFLLQIHNRLDQSCCGFRPRREDVCVELGHHSCGDNIQLANIIYRDQDPRHLVFTNNKGFFDRNEDNLDFRLLEGIKELPEQAVSVLRSRKLREKLLQSLFLDQTYWESQSSRPGIDKLIDIIERRAEVLLTYINAHGIKVIPMNV